MRDYTTGGRQITPRSGRKRSAHGFSTNLRVVCTTVLNRRQPLSCTRNVFPVLKFGFSRDYCGGCLVRDEHIFELRMRARGGINEMFTRGGGTNDRFTGKRTPKTTTAVVCSIRTPGFLREKMRRSYFTNILASYLNAFRDDVCPVTRARLLEYRRFLSHPPYRRIY